MYIHIAQKGKMGCKNLGRKLNFLINVARPIAQFSTFFYFLPKKWQFFRRKLKPMREIGFSKYGLSNINVGNLRRKKHLSTRH